MRREWWQKDVVEAAPGTLARLLNVFRVSPADVRAD
jgi:hypothetical protein